MAGSRRLALLRLLTFPSEEGTPAPSPGEGVGGVDIRSTRTLFSMGNTSALPMTSPSSLMAPGGGCWRDWQLGFLAGPAKVAHDERVLRVGWMVLPCGASATLKLPQVAFSILLQKHRDLLARRRLV